jgi:Putative hemolysin
MPALQPVCSTNPFSLTPDTTSVLTNSFIKVLGRPLGKMLGLDALNARYAKVHTPDEDASQGAFLSRALDELGVRHDISDEDRCRIPLSGPLLIASNHPFGVLEGLVLARLLREIRPDVKILANHLLARIPEMRPHLIVVDPFGGAGAKVRNLAGLREALTWLKNGGALLAFPAGEVASLKITRRMVADPPWQRGVAALARKANVPVLPVFVHGRNGALFQAAGLVHPRLRTMLIPRENLKGQRTVRISAGTAISAERLAAFATDADMSAYLRFRCHLLRRREETAVVKPAPWRTRQAEKTVKAVAAQRPREGRLAEIACLQPERILARSAPFLVFEAGAEDIPDILHEVARLRESTFRQVGEGTGEPLDTDRYDAHYRHLVLWNEEDQEVAGAYRFAPTDQVLAAHGPAGMYLSSQFKLKPEFWDRVGHGLELGRSFVRPKYQKAYQPLLLLWRGLAEYVARNPHNRTLFGCVSISGRLQPPGAGGR